MATSWTKWNPSTSTEEKEVEKEVEKEEEEVVVKIFPLCFSPETRSRIKIQRDQIASAGVRLEKGK